MLIINSIKRLLNKFKVYTYRNRIKDKFKIKDFEIYLDLKFYKEENSGKLIHSHFANDINSNGIKDYIGTIFNLISDSSLHGTLSWNSSEVIEVLNKYEIRPDDKIYYKCLSNIIEYVLEEYTTSVKFKILNIKIKTKGDIRDIKINKILN